MFLFIILIIKEQRLSNSSVPLLPYYYLSVLQLTRQDQDQGGGDCEMTARKMTVDLTYLSFRSSVEPRRIDGTKVCVYPTHMRNPNSHIFYPRKA